MAGATGTAAERQNGTVTTTNADSFPEHHGDAAEGVKDAPLPAQILPIIEQAQRAFVNALPQLLKERPGQWVAYHGSTPVAFGESKMAVYRAAPKEVERAQLFVRKIRTLPSYSIGPGVL